GTCRCAQTKRRPRRWHSSFAGCSRPRLPPRMLRRCWEGDLSGYPWRWPLSPRWPAASSSDQRFDSRWARRSSCSRGEGGTANQRLERGNACRLSPSRRRRRAWGRKEKAGWTQPPLNSRPFAIVFDLMSSVR
ncbi:unnamed protein product, partial [Scytosiphon promiscuus]